VSEAVQQEAGLRETVPADTSRQGSDMPYGRMECFSTGDDEESDA
jgi:hypothetical protein